MARKKTSGLPHATVTRIAHTIPGVRIQQSAVELAAKGAEGYIKSVFDGAKQFMEHRNGTMIMLKDVEAYLASLQN